MSNTKLKSQNLTLYHFIYANLGNWIIEYFDKEITDEKLSFKHGKIAYNFPAEFLKLDQKILDDINIRSIDTLKEFFKLNVSNYFKNQIRDKIVDYLVANYANLRS